MNIKGAYDLHRDLLELHGLERPACSNTLVPRGSHYMSSLWSPVVATGGNQWQIGSGRKATRTSQNRCRGLRPDRKECDEGGPPPVTGSSLSTGSYREEARFNVVRRFGSQPQASRLPPTRRRGRDGRGGRCP